MPQPSRAMTIGSERFAQPGEDPEGTPTVPDIGVPSDDPAYGDIVRALAKLVLAGFDATDPELIARAVAVGRAGQSAQRDVFSRNLRQPRTRQEAEFAAHRERNLAEQARLRAMPRPAAVPTVYYMRIGDRCKIGFTGNLLSRLRTINPEELMAFERGEQSLETQRHREFRRLRTHGEWFLLRDPLTSHIARLAEASQGDIEAIEHPSCRHIR